MFQDKNNTPYIQRLFRSKAVIVFEVLLLVVISSALAKEVVRRYQIQGEIKSLQNQVQQSEQKKTELQGLISYFDSDAFKEEQARLKLGLQKPGESVVTVLGESTEGVNAVAAELGTGTEQKAATTSNPHRWWNRFFNTN